MGDRSLPRRVLLGTAIGDAFGLKGEGLPRRVTAGMTWDRGPFFGRAVFSDDTEQSFLVAQALLAAAGDEDLFARHLRRSLVGWLFAGPPGVGLGTVRSILKLAVGLRRGVSTAGNGAAMRSAVIGAALADDRESIASFVHSSTELTHTDQRAHVGALAVAYAASLGSDVDLRVVNERVSARVQQAPHADRWNDAMREAERALAVDASVYEYAAAIGCADGVSGYVYDTVPVALYAWARHDDPMAGLREVWGCGGDTDSVGAIAGALLFARSTDEPERETLALIADYPLTVARVADAGTRLSNRGAPVRWPWWLMPVRNICVVFPMILFYALVVMLPARLR